MITRRSFFTRTLKCAAGLLGVAMGARVADKLDVAIRSDIVVSSGIYMAPSGTRLPDCSVDGAFDFAGWTKIGEVKHGNHIN